MGGERRIPNGEEFPFELGRDHLTRLQHVMVAVMNSTSGEDACLNGTDPATWNGEAWCGAVSYTEISSASSPITEGLGIEYCPDCVEAVREARLNALPTVPEIERGLRDDMLRVFHIRDDLRVERIPEGDVFKGRSIALAYSSPFGGAGIYMTPAEARSTADGLLAMARRLDP